MPISFPELAEKLKGQIIAHRGAPRLCPENTLSSFRGASHLNATWLEFDIQPCSTGEWVVIHDETVDRTSNGQGQVNLLPYEYLKTLDAGSWFHPQFKGEPLPLLSDTLPLLKTLNLHPNIEIKTERTLKHSELEALLQLLDNWPNSLLPPLLSSFNIDVLRQVQEYRKDFPLGWIIDRFPKDFKKMITSLDLFSIHCNYENLQKEEMALCINQNLKLLVYTVNDSLLAKKLFDDGVWAIFSDHPNLIETFAQ